MGNLHNAELQKVCLVSLPICLFVVLRGEYYSFDRVSFSGYALFVSVMHRFDCAD